MKRTGLVGILALLCLGLVSLETRGDDLERFLAQMQKEAASKPAALRPVKSLTDEKAYSAIFMESSTQANPICSAYVDCPGGGWVECEGYEYCESRRDVCWILCDGVYDSCGICW